MAQLHPFSRLLASTSSLPLSYSYIPKPGLYAYGIYVKFRLALALVGAARRVKC
jgi:hypothetical protein